MLWKYDLDDKPAPRLTVLYALQFLCFNLITCIVLPLIVAPYIGLDEEGLRQLTQRTLFFSGLASLFQVVLGHKYPIFEGPSTLWVSAFVVLGSMASQTGKPLMLLRSEIALGLICAGLICIVLGSLGLMDRVARFFGPAAMGTFFFLVVIQFSGTAIGHMLDITASSPEINWFSAGASVLTILLIMVVSLWGSGFLRSISLLIGALCGWAIYLIMGQLGHLTLSFPDIRGLPLVEPVTFFPWGFPQFDPLVLVTSLIINFIVFSNLLATVKGMGSLMKDTNSRLNKTVIFTGLANVLGGVGGTLGFVPQAQVIGFVSITRVVSRLPFIVQGVMFMILGLIPAVGVVFTSIPLPIGYAVFLAILTQVVAMGIKEYNRIEMNDRNTFVVGASLLSGTGLMFLPTEALSDVPVFVSGLLSNGLIVGLLCCIILDNVLKK